MDKFITIIMAAGEGKRMNSNTPKVLQKASGKALVDWVINLAGDKNPIVVVGHKRELVEKHLQGRADFVVQNEQKGTGHAVLMAKQQLIANKDGYALILAGDMPLIQPQTIEKLKEKALAGNDVVILTAVVDKPFGYGRIITDENQKVLGIVEEKDATDAQRQIKEVNSSVYCFKISLLLEALDKLTCNNASGEYYLTDCIKHLSVKSKITTLKVDFEECLGVNDKIQLAQASKVLYKRINEKHMLNGVNILDPATTYIGSDVVIGKDTVVYPNNILEGKTIIAANTTILQGNRIADSNIGEGSTVQSSVLTEATIGANTSVGPFAYLRPNSNIGSGCRIGDFVEVKNSKIDDGSKVSHLSYVGDSTVGKNVNIGCGVVFVNYDGANKDKCEVGDNCFIGCNTNLIAPVDIQNDAYVAAGSTVTNTVPSGALCIARARQVIKKDWLKPKKHK